MKINTDRPYDNVAEIISRWSEDNGYSDMVVLLKIDGDIETVYLGLNSYLDYEWEYDWYEGGEVELLGFCPVSEVIIPDKYLLNEQE